MNRKYTAIIPVLILGIPILTDNYYSRKCLREPLLVRKQGYRYITNHI